MWRRGDEVRAGLLLVLLACSWTATRADLSISLPAFPTGDISTACVNTAGGSDWDAESFTSVYSAGVGGNDYAGTLPLVRSVGYSSIVVADAACRRGRMAARL